MEDIITYEELCDYQQWKAERMREVREEMKQSNIDETVPAHVTEDDKLCIDCLNENFCKTHNVFKSECFGNDKANFNKTVPAHVAKEPAKKRQTNLDRICSMSAKKLAKKIFKLLSNSSVRQSEMCCVCPAQGNCKLTDDNCVKEIKKWLKAESGDSDG